MNIPITNPPVQNQTANSPNAVTMNFTPKPLGVINPPAPSGHPVTDSLKTEHLNAESLKDRFEKKSENNAQKGIKKASGAFLMLMGALTVAGYLLFNSKTKPITTVKELEMHIKDLTKTVKDNSLLGSLDRKITLYFPSDDPLYVGNKATKTKVQDVKDAFKQLQIYISRFADDGETHEIKVYLKNPESGEDKVREAIKEMTADYKFGKDRKLSYIFKDELCSEVERIELGIKEPESWFESFNWKLVKRENPVVVKIISPTYVDDRNVNTAVFDLIIEKFIK